MSTWTLFLAHVLLFAAVPVVITVRRGPLTTPLLYAYLAVVLTLGGFLSGVYAFPLAHDISIGAGSVAYGGLMFTALILLITTRDLAAIRDVIKLVAVMALFKIAFGALAVTSLRSDDLTNPFGTSREVFAFSLQVVSVGAVLNVVELILLVATFEKVKRHGRLSSLHSLWYLAAFAAVLVLDGVLFPLLDQPRADDLGHQIWTGVQGKALLAAAYAVPLAAYLALFRHRVALYEAKLLAVGSLLRLPNTVLLKEIERQEQALEYQATHDTLTGLANREELRLRIDEALTSRNRHGTNCIAVVFIDLDDFKLVNDGHGHAAGDTVLITVAERVRSCLRDGDVGARLGGDEFTVLLADVADTAAAVAVGHRILDRLCEPIAIETTTVSVHASIGIAFAEPHADTDADRLLRNADLAMYRAKDLGKDRVEVFTEDLHRRAQARAELLTEINAGIDAGEFLPHYQPVVELSSGRLVGVEALMRWQHPRRGLLGPVEFINLAEGSTAILAMGEQILTRACADAVGWAHRTQRDVGLSVNVSTRQLRDPALVSQVAYALRQSGLAAHLLTLEITESSLMSEVHGSVRTVEELKAIGVHISIDDFGTGFSSLAYLHRLPVDILKIDKSFIDHICDGNVRSGGPLVQSIVGLGNLLDLQVIAEGIESDEQCRALVDLGCLLGQGFHFAPALPSGQIAALLDLEHEGHLAWG